MRTLMVKTSSLGDVVHAMPVARALIGAGHEVDWVVNEEYTGLVALVQGIGRVLPFPRRRLRGPCGWIRFMGELRGWAGNDYDWAIDVQGLLKSALIARAVRPRRLIGLADAREGSRWFYDEVVAVPSPRGHAVDRYLGVLRHLGIPEPAPLDYGLRPGGCKRGPDASGAVWIGLQGGARWPTKLWPEQYWYDLVALARAQNPALRFVVLGGSPMECGLGAGLSSRFPDGVKDCTGFRPWSELVDLLGGLVGLVGPDTGPLHLAVACGIPVCALMGPTRPEWTGPYGAGNSTLQAEEIPCVPCLRRTCRYREPMACMKAIRPDVVAAIVLGWAESAG